MPRRTIDSKPIAKYFRSIDRDRDALVELDDCRVFVSPLSSKLLSVGPSSRHAMIIIRSSEVVTSTWECPMSRQQ